MSENQTILCDDKLPLIIPKKIMVIAGHPDDELVSCGGTLLKYRELGSEIIIVVATQGKGGYAKESHKESIVKHRENELKHVSEVLKSELIELNYSDMEVNREKVSKITNLIRYYRPQVILMPPFSDFHRVHV